MHDPQPAGRRFHGAFKSLSWQFRSVIRDHLGAMEASLVTIVVCDLTRPSDTQRDRAAEAVRRAHFLALRAAVAAHGGRELKSTDDGLGAMFASARAAVRCAVEMHRASIEQRAWPPLRVGVAAGEPTAEGDDPRSTAIIVASRLCAAAEPGGLLISDVVARVVGPGMFEPMRPAGPFELAGFREPVAAQSVRWSAAAPELWIGLLGPLTVTRAGESVTIAGARQRAILALLALNVGDAVSVAYLVDGVWDERSRPQNASAALQTQISRLRALLGDGVIVTRPPGYLLDLAPDQIDAHVFRTLSTDAQREVATGDALRARRSAEAAIRLIRGAPLADIEDAPFGDDAQRTLEEDRLVALESLMQARLELGQHADVIDELRTLASRSPYHERLWAQLMLALYRSGRQADALDAYADVRRLFAMELGLEPGPALTSLHAQILRHDPALAPPRRPSPPAAPRVSRRPKRRTPSVLGAFTTAAVAAAVAIQALSGPGSTHSGAGPQPGGTVVRLDAATGAVRDRIPVGPSPGPIVVGAGAIWALDVEADTVTEIRSDHAVATFALGAPLIDVAAGNQLFVGTGASAADAQIAGPVVAAVQRVSPVTRTVRAKTDLPRAATIERPPDQQLAFFGGDLWSITADGSVARIRRDSIDGHLRGVVATSIAAGTAGLWIIEDDGTVARLDPTRLGVSAQIRPAATSLSSLAVGAHEIWTSSPADGVVWRIPSGRPLGAQPIRLQAGVGAIAVASGSAWVANPLHGTVTRLDERTGRVEQTIAVGGEPRGLVAAGGSLWVSVGSPGPTAGEVGAGLGAASCEPAYVQRGVRPDALLVSDLPLQGGIRVSTTDMTAAIALELRLHAFRAGRYRVGYVSCDDSDARTGIFDQVRCAANARAYVSAPKVLAIVGSLNSPCTAAALTEIRRAGANAPAMVSPLSSDPALTRNLDSPSFARVFPTDDLQAAALASVARELGAKRVYVLDDGDPGYGSTLADALLRAAARVGLRIVGSDSWNPARPASTQPLQRAAAATPDAVVLAGTLDDGGISVLRGLRRLLPRNTILLLTDGFTPTDYLAQRAGTAAQGAYVSVSGATLDALTSTGRAFERELATIAPGAETDPASYYAAESAQVLLDAIAVSNGTRSSVSRAMRATDLRSGMFGPVGFDNHGDIRQPAISILEVNVGDRSRQDFPDTKLFQVLRPSRTLVAP